MHTTRNPCDFCWLKQPYVLWAVSCMLVFIITLQLSPRGYPNDIGDQMRVTVLGTGTPYPKAQRFGPAILLEAASQKMLFDCGRGTVIRLSQNGVPVEAIRDVYLTHLHSDHVTGLPDLWLTGWFLGRKKPLRVWGPTGTLLMTRHLTEAFAFDLQIRQKTESLPPEGAEFDAYEIPKETVYDDGPVRVTSFPVDHGPVKPAFGYRIDYAGHSLVISGDTKFSPELVRIAKRTDCLIHVAWAVGDRNPTPSAQRSIATAEDAARTFMEVHPRLAVVYHYKEENGVGDAIREIYSGSFVIARDLMTIVISRKISWKNGCDSGTVE